MYQLKKLKSLLLLLCIAVTAQAQISNGKVYNFVNVAYNTQSLAITSGEYITIVPTNQDGSEQLWYAEGNETDGYTLRSLCSGYYLRSSNGQSVKWTMVSTPDANCKLKCHTAGNDYTFRATNTTNDWHSMHLATSQGSHLVGWTSSASATQWIINEVSVTSEQLTALLDKADEVAGAVNNVTTYQSALNNLFSDKACTQLKKSFASESAVTSDADYLALPATLQQMVLKVYKDSWAEDNYDTNKSDWDADYAKKYRVQFYEPYNEPECAASALGLNAHTNLNNPTGIFANVQDVLYVMVDGEIKDGSALYLASYKGNGKLSGYRDGVQLKQGLNIIPSFEAGNNYCINYVVHTFDTSKGKGNKAKARKLSDYADLKIHIEGGYINGYWNKMGDYNQTGNDVLYAPDKNADWDYIAARATQTTVTVLGEYITLQFPLNTALNDAGGEEFGLSHYYTGKNIIESSIDEWDNVMMWERIVLGVLDKTTTEDAAKNPKSPYAVAPNVFAYIGDDTDGFESGYDDYYNVHGLSYGTPHGYMYGSWDHCGYHYNTMGAIMVSMITDAGSHWGPAHEIGHQHQGLLTVNGLTEVTNNLFSNVVLWYFGKTTSRVNGSALEPIAEMFANEEADFFNTTSNVFITTQMYYKLFLYYHVLGHNPKFYPKLFEMLRQDPMTGGYYQQGSTTLLHFYKKCCEAAGEDLTEFFRAYGFFRVMTDRLVGDYANSEYTQTQSDIDEAIAEVKAMAAEKGWEQNIAVLFINDDPGEKILSHRDDVEYLTPYESADSELGCYASYVNTTDPNYTYTITGNTVTMTGEGGTGIAIFNEKGELIGFSDNKTFEVSDECAIAIASGQAEVVAMKADNTTVETVDIMDTDDNEAKYALLGELLNEAKAIVELSDESNSKLGYYRKEALTDLQTAYTNAKTVYDAKTVASYDAVYDALNEAYSEMLHNDYARIGLVEGNSYRLTNKAYPTRLMTVNTNNNQMFGLVESTDNPDSQLWYLESSDTEGRYYLKNKATSKYPGNVSTGAVLSANQEKDAAHAYELRDMGQGVWALVGNTGLHCSASQSYNIVGWGTDASATQWYITAVDKDDDAEALYNLQAQIAKTEALIDEVGYATQVQLQATDSLAPFHLYCNALFKALNDADTSPNTAKLLDGDPATHIHTEYRTNEGDYKADDDLDHYLRVDWGSGNAVSEIKFTYTTRNAGDSNAHPKTIKIEGSNNLITFEEIATLPRTGETALPGANTNNDGRGKYTSPTITNGKAYRYLRFMVTETQGTGKSYGNHPYFYMAEFDLELDNIVRVDDKYSSEITVDELTDVFNSLLSAKEIVENTNSEQYAAACSALEGYYNTLLADKNRVETSNLTALKDELAALIGETTDLIGECGTVKVVQGGALTLSVTPGDDVNYLTAGPNSNPSEGALSNLIDNDSGTSFTSNWDSQTGNPYLQVQLPDGKELSKFTFTFTARDGGGAPTPSVIVVSGSNDGQNFTTIETFTKESHGFPAAASGEQWISPEVTAETAYKYLRFTVTKSERTTSGADAPSGYYHFGISHFGVSTVSETVITLLSTAGGATKEDVLAAYNQKAESQAVYDYATSELQVKAAIEKLVAAKLALEVAKGDALEYTVTVVGGNSQGGVVYGGTNRVGGVKFSAPTDLSVNDLEAIPLDGYVANGVALDGTTITVTYNKVYSVQVVGVEPANGGVKLGETTYAGGATFDMLESSFDINNFTAIPVTGYAAYKTFEGSTITVTYKKVYTVNVVGVDAANGGVTSGEATYKGGATFEMLESEFNIDNFDVIDLQGYEENKAFEGATITITYNKVYTIQVTGGGGNGRIAYDGTSYANGETFSMLETSFDESKLSTIIPDGYQVKEKITVDDATGIISVVYAATPLVDTEKYYTLECRSGAAHSTERFIRDNGTVINGRSSEGSLFQFEKADDDNGYYIKSYVTGYYINHTADGNKVYASADKVTVWTMAAPSHTPAARTLNVVGNNLYLNNNASDCTDGTCTNLQSLSHNGGAPGSGNACSLWTVTEGTPLDMTELENLINSTNSLIASCYQNGNVEGELLYFNSAYVNADVMAATKTAVANAQAKYDAGRATTQGEYTAVLADLQNANTTLTSNISLAKTEANDRLASREALREKIEALGDVIDLCGVVEWGRYPTGRVAVSLTEADLSTNAQEKSEGPIANLLTDDGFFHSSWTAAMGGEHYLQVDLGEGRTLQEFVFGYTTRSNGPHPYIIVVSGSNSLNDSFEEIKVFNSGLPNSGSASWEATAPIVASQPYRYLRFTVTKSSDLRPYGEYCFAMSKFELKTIAYSENEDYYVEYLDPNGSVTEEQLLDAYRTMIAAGKLDNVNTTKTELDAKIEELQNLCAQLTTKRNTLQLPVELTTDIKNPVLYTFKSQRGDAKALKYDPASNHMFSIADADANSVKQMFYFTMGDTKTQVYVHPFVAGEQVLAANNTSDGAAKVFAAVNPAESMARQWTFESETIDGSTWYSLKGVGTPYFSNYGGGSNKMGFYSNKDDGSRFQFIDVDETTVEGSAAYHSLNVYYTEAAKVASSEIVGGSNPYYYPEVEAVAYNKAYTAATDALEAESCAYEDYLSAYKALLKANEDENFVLQMPSADKFYRFVSVVKKDGNDNYAYVYANPADNKMYWATDKGASDATAIWSIAPSETEGMYNVTNLHTGSSINGFINYNPSPLSETEGNVSIVSLSVNGQVGIKCNGSMMHAQGGGSVVHWDTGADDGSAWRIVEVEDMSLVKFAVSISQYEHAGLYLNYPVTIPDGVKAYYLDGTKITIDDGVGSLNLTKIEDDVIPAKTAVILYAPHGNQTVGYDFVYTEAQGGEYNKLLTGSAYQTFREAQENHNYYVFGQKGGVIGLYKNSVKYNASGTDGTTHYKMSANKILFDWDGSVSNVSSFRFRLGTGGQTTSLEDALMMDNTIIYDLYGRRILEVIESGLYIVNGEKRYVQVK